MAASPPLHPKPVVLIAEDEPVVSRFLGQALAPLFQVVKAYGAGPALAAAKAACPDSALIDYRLGMDNGVEVAVQIHGLCPSISVFVMTGWQLTAEDARLCEQHQITVLFKPFPLKELIGAILAGMKKDHS